MDENYGFKPRAEIPSDENYGFTAKPTSRKNNFNPLKEAVRNMFGMPIVEGLPEAAPTFIKDVGDLAKRFGTSMIEGGPMAVKETWDNPLTSAKQLAAGLSQGAVNTLNIPRDIPSLFAHYGYMMPEEAKGVQSKMYNEVKLPQFLKNYFGEPETKGQNFLRDIGELLVPYLGTASKVTKPLSDIQKMERIVNAETKAKKLYSGKYNDLFNKARESGHGRVTYDPNEIKMDLISKHTNPDAIAAMNNFLTSPTLENAQQAIHELGHIERSPEMKARTKEDWRLDLQDDVQRAKKNILANMFKDEEGKVNTKLVDKHRAIQNGFEKDVARFRVEPISLYKAKRMRAQTAVDKLKNEEAFLTAHENAFPFLKENAAARLVKKHPYLSLLGGSFGLSEGNELMKYLLSKPENENERND